MASKYLQKYQVPEGFYDILHEFSREILRAQPEDIIDYAANYFEAKVQGKEYYYESKYNVQRNQGESKQYAPTPAADYSHQAKQVVNKQPSNSGQGKRPATQNSLKSEVSHPDEKKITSEVIGGIYDSAIHKALNSDEEENDFRQQQQDQDEGQNQQEDEEVDRFGDERGREEEEEEQQEKNYEQQEGERELEREQQVRGEGQEQVQQRQQQREEVVLDGPVEDYENVALKIQSVFRGSQVRKNKKN